MKSLKLNYHNISSELCDIWTRHSAKEQSQILNKNDRNCHPYTLFYNGLFTNKKNDNLTIAEFGITNGAPLLMWREYFKNANIYGFEYNTELITNFKTQYDNKRITLEQLDLTNKNSISTAFSETNTLFDIIIEGTLHKFEDQINFIENVYKYLQPGGVLIIEDIFKSYNEKWYINRLNPILEHFQDFCFIEFQDSNKNITGKNNKLLLLVKSGEPAIFENENKITIITPSYRVENLLNVKNSINFKYVEEWIIVYDGSKITDNPNLFKGQENDKIKEYVYLGNGSSGNPQRNYALSKLTNTNTSLYYLDDDNIINPNIYTLLNIMEKNKMYTFNQYNPTSIYSEKNILKGDTICVKHIDTAMVIIPYDLCKDIRWIFDNYFADGFYIQDCYAKNMNNHIFVDNELSYYNSMCA